MTKSLLSTLSITERPVTQSNDPIIQRQNKLIGRLETQLEMAKCHIENEVFTAYKEQWITDPLTKVKSKVRVQKRVKAWFYQVKGNYFMEVKYGSKSLELAKDKYVITIGEQDKLIPTIELIIDAVRAGEFDTHLSKIKRVGVKA
ncbi:hypothetical protein RGQ13_00535 [Thalassotalea psychrophila]|uniref:Uncharacterized protein n=1 Tax=Thalassotalea psychrophila TaxID=3065647 RepID=A0ABY9TUG7_9GAMM|nr:hypothetical protein RGQ13_00535 [Colwelliaceae bacterium SQ149]